MKNLVLCCDGTWNSPQRRGFLGREKARTNVVIFHQSVIMGANAGAAQKSHYITGVGSHGSPIEKLGGGAFAWGLKVDILEGYLWLAQQWRVGDSIHILGFSRGAYTARSVAGLVAAAGLPDLTGDTSEIEDLVRRHRDAAAKLLDWSRSGPADARGAAPAVFAGGLRKVDSIAFVGAWDTVGSLGIPQNVALGRWLSGRHAKHRFTDTRLSPKVVRAAHALSLDEQRYDFTPTLWSVSQDPNPDRIVQTWFTGSHGNVGGGYLARGLSNITYDWMVAQALDASTLSLPDPRAQMGMDATQRPTDDPDDSRVAFWRRRPARIRAVPNVADDPSVHPAARKKLIASRRSAAPYWPTQRLQVGQSVTVQVPASERRFLTGIYMERGEGYDISARGSWTDKTYVCGPEGLPEAQTRRSVGYRIAGYFESKRRKLRKKNKTREVEYFACRHFDTENWFALLGMVSNQRGIVDASVNVLDHQSFHIGSGIEGFSPARPGYFYAFANDAWAFYGNNSGALTVTITRVQ